MSQLSEDLETIHKALHTGQVSAVKVDAQRALVRVMDRCLGEGHSRVYLPKVIAFTESGGEVHGIGRTVDMTSDLQRGRVAEAIETLEVALRHVARARHHSTIAEGFLPETMTHLNSVPKILDWLSDAEELLTVQIQTLRENK